jgi:hypothetical protein
MARGSANQRVSGGDIVSDPAIISDAVLSECGLYRYRLSRVWNPQLGRVVFVMLNPSTADASRDDPTIRRCIGFAKLWGFGSIEVVNLYAFRSTDPAGLLTASDAIGPDNDRHIEEACRAAGLIVCAWGTKGGMRAGMVALRLAHLGFAMKCLGKTQQGHPKHPLYVPSAAELIPFGLERWPEVAIDGWISAD